MTEREVLKAIHKLAAGQAGVVITYAQVAHHLAVPLDEVSAVSSALESRGKCETNERGAWLTEAGVSEARS